LVAEDQGEGRAPDAQENEAALVPATAAAVTGAVNPGASGKVAPNQRQEQMRGRAGAENAGAGVAGGNGGAIAATGGDMRNQRALEVVRRIQNKLSGRDFNPQESLGVAAQIERLVQDATSKENLCVAFVGWCSFW
jgi:FKBP12-rapamycin complex-associated protein